MNEFQAMRITREFTHNVPATPAKVFPLLCPTRERDWIDGWNCRLIYSVSGVAENNCIFTTDFPRGREEVWVVSRYEPESHVIQFTVFCPEAYVMKLDVSLKASGENSSNILWSITFTGLTDEGNSFIQEHCDKDAAKRMDLLFKVLDYYCSTGKMLKKDSMLAGLHSALHAH